MQERFRKMNPLTFLEIVAVFGAGYVANDLIQSFRSSKPEPLPSGQWVDFDPSLTLYAVNAYPTENSGIDYVNMTYQDSNGDWRSACIADEAEISNLFICQGEFTEVLPGESVIISFDVVDTKGNVSYAPDGMRTVALPATNP